ncbi:hypothetical protein P154DRAFT_209390 [Amniculicola lignicola CBS 123094]|uniref:Uncharacterized protein n=1 Tax=Amniculicola lignicola CBS 123094 TaxID=1392246 RepID=A0A6A5WDZ7_9PLEO|nr:hypothetical protein P154DRAFT_209390 [Amniculicola lignicola CBS 123094]
MENGSPRRHDGRAHTTETPANERVTGGGSEGTQPGHKRSLSGSILGSLFLRSSPKDAPSRASPRREDALDEELGADGESSHRGSSLSLANALRQGQARKRKGSLRKTALLGTGKLMRERRNSIRDKLAPKPAAINTSTPMDAVSPNDDDTTPRRFSYEHPSLNSSSDSGWTPPAKLSLTTANSQSFDVRDGLTPRVLTSPVGPYASTTDDDDGLFFHRPSASSSSFASAQLQPPGPSSALQRRRSNRSSHQNSSLTIVHTPAELALEDEWDYSETEWWGWVVLIATWIVFVVGMGSCLGVWSWAWDVGETPYAPPELEDDDTLPITGYYPALMVCTAVMAWVWVVVAWVGMKYFRHAKVVGEDG